MKRVAVISLMSVLLITQYTYASCLLEGCSKTVEISQCQELTQEETEELFMEVLSTTDWGQIQQNPNFCRIFASLTFLSLFVNPSLPTEFAVNTYILYLLLCGAHPSPQFGSISPEQGEQESTFINVQISSFNTTFLDGYPIFVQFNPSAGLTISNLRALSNTLLEFDLEIAVDTPLGFKSVTVTHGEPPTSLVGVSVFEVRE
jgi:hypothetical protein